MKKVLSLVLVLSMLLSFALPALGAEAASDNGSFSKVLVDLSNQAAISKAGLKATTEFSKSGSFTALLSGDSLKKTSSVPVEMKDISQAQYLEMYIYAPESTATAFALALVSDNPETAIVDFYYVLVPCNFKGWKNCSFKLSGLRKTGTPLGLDKIEKVMIMPGYSGSMVDENARLYLDNVRVSSEPSADANKEEVPPPIKPHIIYDPEKGLPPGKTGCVLTEFDGRTVLKWGPGDEELRAGFGKPTFPGADTMKKYKELVIEVYSVKNTGNSFLFRLYGAAGTHRFYTAQWMNDWGGEWKEIRLPISGGKEGTGSFGRMDSKTEQVDFEIYEASFLTLTTPPYTSTPFFPNTEVYIGKIYLDGNAVGKTVPNPTGEIIYPDNYDPATMTDYVGMIKEKHPNKHHPRIIVTDELLARIKKYKDTDPFMKKVYNYVQTLANTYVETPPTPPSYMNTQGTLTRFNRTIEDLTKCCGLMYLLSDDEAEKEKYANRIWDEVKNMAASELYWYDTGTGLDSAHITNGMALAYDWLYDHWDREQKLLMRNAMMNHGLSYASAIRGGSGYMTFRNNVVAANSKGFMSAALAFCDEEGYENFCNEFINNVITYLPVYLYPQFRPNGNYAEGSGYWTYTINCLAHMFTAMQTAMGTDGGLSEEEGLAKTGLWAFGMRGPMGDFNHSDANINALQSGSPAYHYFTDRYDLPSLRAFRLDTYEKYEGIAVEDLFWYNPDAKVQLDWREGLPTDYFFDGFEPIISLRSSYDPDANFIAAKGGNRMTGHDQSDAGSYVMDALGVRWICDTGAGVYAADLPEEYYYRNRAEAHNCLYFNPELGGGKTGGQTVPTNNVDTLCPIIDSGISDGASFGVLDMWPSYKEDTIEYKRGVALINNRTQFMVRDEFKGTKPSELYSYFHTSKSNEITINPDGKSLTMKTKNGQMCKVNIITDLPEFELGVMEAIPHPASPRPGPDNVQDHSTATMHKFYIHAYNVKDATITAVFTPMVEDAPVTMPEILPLSDWDKYLEMKTPLTGISIDDIPLADFNPGLGVYNFECDKLGTVTATAADGVKLEITQAEKLGEAALIKATNTKTNASFTYKVNFVPYVVPGLASGAPFVSVDPHHVSEPQNGPDKLNDGDMTTRFAIDGYDGQAYFTIDLGTSKYVTGVSIAFYGGSSRKNKFKIETSEDKNTWTEALPTCFSPGNSDQLISYDLTPSWARYIRFTGYGAYAGDEETQSSKWNSISEFVVAEERVDFTDTTGHWAQPDILFARNYGLVNGVGDNKYAPENPVTRAEFVTMVVRACKFADVPYEEGTYSDVKKDDWYSTAIMTALDKGIIPSEMTKDGKFKPNEKLTREEMCAIAALAYSQTVRREAPASGATKAFKDLSDSPYLTYIDKAIGLRLTNGMSANTFAPKNSITRAQAATILRRLYLKNYNVNN